MSKHKVVVRRFREKQSDDNFSNIDLIYTVHGDKEALKAIADNWNFRDGDTDKFKHIRLSFTNPSSEVIQKHKDKITPILLSTSNAILLSKNKDETVAFWCKFRLQALASYDLEFEDRIDEDPMEKAELDVVIGKEGNFKTEESTK